MARPWKPARRCSACLYPNDSDASYCQASGTLTGPRCSVAPVPPLDETAIQERFDEFQSVFRSKPYERRRSALEQQVPGCSLSPPRTMTSCTAQDTVKFLISKDRSGRTVVRLPSCSKRGCSCHKRLAAGSVDSTLGRLRAIFNKLRRAYDSNPASHPLVKDYLKFVREEQAGLAITPSQAVPIFFEKFQWLIAHLRDLCSSSVSLSSASKNILVWDATFSDVDFFTGDRASVLGRLPSCNAFRLRDREGFLLRFTLTKNLRKGPPRSVPLIKLSHSDVCPVAWIQYYITVCQCLKVPLDQGYFFRTLERCGSIWGKPFTGSVVNNRFRKHLSEAKLYAGETPNSFRVGQSNTLSLLGCSSADVALYLGWKSEEIAKRYMQGSDATVSITLPEKVFPRAPSG